MLVDIDVVNVMAAFDTINCPDQRQKLHTLSGGGQLYELWKPHFRRQLRQESCINNTKHVVCFLLGDSPASDLYMPTFRNTLSVPSSKANLPLKM